LFTAKSICSPFGGSGQKPKQMKNQFIAVMDYSTAQVKVYETFVPSDYITEFIEEFIEAQGHRIADCYWLASTENPITS